jgi:Fe-Mn family superoxide dismutase
MTFKLTELPWPRDALAPVISAETIDYHHGKHHRAYVDKLNGLVSGTAHENASLQELVVGTEGALFNNAAQAWNHDFYWHCLSPAPAAPDSALAKAIDTVFGSQEALREAFIRSAAGKFGSGWTWLVVTADQDLEILNTDDAGNPLRQGKTPLLTLDVWEHAYYIDYRNDRKGYLEAVWDLVNWEFVAANLAATRA